MRSRKQGNKKRKGEGWTHLGALLAILSLLTISIFGSHFVSDFFQIILPSALFILSMFCYAYGMLQLARNNDKKDEPTLGEKGQRDEHIS